MRYFQLQNPGRIATNNFEITLNENELYEWSEVNYDEDGTFPFKFGKPLSITNVIQGRCTGESPIPLVFVGAVALFAHTDIAKKCEQLFRSELQLFDIQFNDCFADAISIINITNKLDCIDFINSDIEMDPLEPNLCQVIRRLSLRQTAINPSLSVFILRSAADVIVVSENGKKQFIKAGFPRDYFSTELLVR